MKPTTYAASAACVIFAALLLRLPALEFGFTVDDYAQLGMMKGFYPVPRAPLQLFTFSDGTPEENEALRQAGFFPFWSHPELRISMFRPLSSALMWLDLAWFGLDAYAYHLHGLAWWLCLLGLAAALFRSLAPPAIALLALALFALEEAHAILLGWIAMRNATVASVFAVLALIGLERVRRGGSLAPAKGALVCFALALTASEYAVAYAGYVVLLELAWPEGRLRRLGAWVALLAGYFAVRGALSFGSYGSGMYVDPIAEPAELVSATLVRLPVLAGDLFAGVRSSFWTGGFPFASDLAARGTIPWTWVTDMRPLRAIQEGLGWPLLALGAGFTVWVARSAPAQARALALGAPLALLPVLSSLPESRLLVPAALGWSLTIALGLGAAIARLRMRAGAGGVLAFGLVTGLTVHHLVLPGWYGRLDSRHGKELAAAVRESITAPELDLRLATAEHVLLLGAADPTTTIYVPLVRRIHGRRGPRACHLLAGTFSPHELQRRGPKTFALRRLQHGYTPGDVYASAFNSRPLRAGARVQLFGMRVTLERVHDGRPLLTRYDFDRSLDDPSVVLLAQTAQGLRVVPFPPIGERVVVASPVPPYELIPRSSD
jgi:hypothetical protein